MKELAEVINRNGFVYKQIKRGDRAAIYSQIISDEEIRGNFEAFEVFKIKIGKAKVVFGVELPEKEKFPSDEDFGKWAWSYTDYSKALFKYERIENGEDEDGEDE
jgi:hypothetical protein